LERETLAKGEKPMRIALYGTVGSAMLLAALLFASSARATDCNDPLVLAAFRADSLPPDCQPTRIQFAEPGLRVLTTRNGLTERSEVTFTVRVAPEEWRRSTLSSSVTLWQGSYNPTRNDYPLMLRGVVQKGLRLRLTYIW